MSDLIPRARDFALRHHKDIIFKTKSGFDLPQTLHLHEVSHLVWMSGGSIEEIAAAWLHDVVEDTAVTHDDIEKQFGQNIAKIVYGLTDLDEYKNWPVAKRKARQAERVKTESNSVRRVKIADQISNVRSIFLDPPTWPTEDIVSYVDGAKRIVDECRGVSDMLDSLFIAVYEDGRKRYAA